MKLKFNIYLLICFLGSTVAFSQVKDQENKSIRIPAEISPTNKDSSLTKVKVAPKFDVEDDKAGGKANTKANNYVSKVEKRPFSMVYNDGLKDPGQIFEQRWKKDAAKSGIVRTMSDQFLGEHRVDSKFVNIICRYHEYPDGDRVEISVNDQLVNSNLLLTSSYRKVQVNLLDGKNTIEIKALNQGDSGPNTAEFLVYDDKGNLVSSKEWNLLTGVKAIIVFINEKTVIKPKVSEITKSEEETSSN